mmetsp:Transcript_3223/g.5008  ORF Transcript_3223/g.5008 Transcript_3223/m.5008 type:complete len:352 (-) Transcript_3223:161-1216(-)
MDSFDPHSLLMKIRGGQASKQPDIPSRSENESHQSSHKRSSYGHQSSDISSAYMSTKPNIATLAPKFERPDVRIELENHVQQLSEEISRLKATNKQLILEKRELEERLVDQKDRSDDVIAKLRNHVASLNKKLNALKASPNNKQKLSAKKAINESFNRVSQRNGRTGVPSTEKSFAGPTFSEIMRRATSDNDDFTTSLRKQRNSKTPHQNHFSQSQSPPHGYEGNNYYDDAYDPYYSKVYDNSSTHVTNGTSTNSSGNATMGGSSIPFRRQASSMSVHDDKLPENRMLRSHSSVSNAGIQGNNQNPSLMRTPSQGISEDGDDEYGEEEQQYSYEQDDEDDDIPVVDIDLRY